MHTRTLGPFTVTAIGLGCMNLSHAYGVPPPPQQGERVLLAALDAGVTLFDTAALYGFGRNEELVGRVLKPHRGRITLCSKGGLAGVPVRHFGIVLPMADWEALAARLKAQGTAFVIEPYLRFQGQPGEQATMFFRDPSGNAIELKAFADLGQLFAKD